MDIKLTIYSIIKTILGIMGIVSIIPSVLLIPSLIVTGTISIIKKNAKYIKINLLVWGLSLLSLLIVLIIYALTTFIFVNLGVEL